LSNFGVRAITLETITQKIRRGLSLKKAWKLMAVAMLVQTRMSGQAQDEARPPQNSCYLHPSTDHSVRAFAESQRPQTRERSLHFPIRIMLFKLQIPRSCIAPMLHITVDWTPHGNCGNRPSKLLEGDMQVVPAVIPLRHTSHRKGRQVAASSCTWRCAGGIPNHSLVSGHPTV
jgi:hypothetical protein